MPAKGRGGDRDMKWLVMSALTVASALQIMSLSNSDVNGCHKLEEGPAATLQLYHTCRRRPHMPIWKQKYQHLKHETCYISIDIDIKTSFINKAKFTVIEKTADYHHK